MKQCEQIGLMATKYYGGDVEKATLMEKLINECDVGEFKLTDEEFMRIIGEHNFTEETEGEVMDMMVRIPEERGVFMRVPYGWIFIEHQEDPGDYSGRLFLNSDGSLDHKFINSIAD